MVHHHRIYFLQLRTLEEEEEQQHLMNSNNQWGTKRTKPTNLHLIFLFSLFSFTLAFLLFSSSASSQLCPLLYPFGKEEFTVEDKRTGSLCLSVPNNTIYCDRTAFRTDQCCIKGDVRTHSPSNSIFLLSSTTTTNNKSEEKIKPYPRKWETNIMTSIQELHLKVGTRDHPCDVRHQVPAVVFSTGGYTGNVYHEFNDGIIPLYITSQHLHKKVVFVVLQHKNWWITKYRDVLSRLSDYPPVTFSDDSRTHCFPEAVVGLRIHGDLTVDSKIMEENKSIGDFRRVLDEAYGPRIKSLEAAENETDSRPKLAIVSRIGSRVIENEAELAAAAGAVGFRVEILRPDRTTELAKIYRALNSSDAMVGVHGAAMTHFLFMRPGSVFVQIVPLGTDWAAETYYGEPAVKMGLRYLGYKIEPRESSLYGEYEKGDPVLEDPSSVNARGWEATKRIYLDGQNVRLDLGRFRVRLERAYQYLVSKRKIAD